MTAKRRTLDAVSRFLRYSRLLRLLTCRFFVTTSTFSQAAKETADLLSKRIVLIDGLLLTRLMIRFDIGCRIEEVVYIKKLDEDFFD